MKYPVIIVMGVSGCGKTGLSTALAERLGLARIEGDDLHPPANIERMSAGLPLRDEDRMPWLALIGEAIRKARATGQGVVVTCSALKRIYRDQLRATAGEPVLFLWLDGTQDLIGTRMSARRSHFMPPALLQSQFDALEPPVNEPDCVRLGVEGSREAVFEAALKLL